MSFGFKAVNYQGETVIDQDFLNYALAHEGAQWCGDGVTTIWFPSAVPSLDAPIICAKRWAGGGYTQGVSAIGWPGNWTGFQVRVAFGGVPFIWRAYATGLEPLETWGMQVFTADGRRVFDSSRPLLTFKGEISGITALWAHTGGAVYQDARTDGYVYRGGPVGVNDYLAIGVLTPAFFGVVNTSRGQVGTVTQVLYGYTADGSPRLFLESYMDSRGLPGPPGAIFYDLPTMPIVAY